MSCLEFYKNSIEMTNNGTTGAIKCLGIYLKDLKIYLEVSLLVKIDFELDFSALFDLVRKSKISIAITISFPDTHSIVTFRVSN